MLPPHRTRPDPLALEPRRVGEHRCKAGRARAFGHGPLIGRIGVDRALDRRLVHQDDLGDEIAHDRERQPPDGLDRNALSQGRAADRAVLAGDRVVKRGIERRLDADDFDRGLEGLGCDRDPRDQPASADRHDDLVQIRCIRQKLEGDGALAGHDGRVVIGVDERQVLLGGDLAGSLGGFVQGVAKENDGRAVGPGVFGFHQRGADRHHDGGRNAEALGVVGHGLRVIAGRHRDDAAPALVRAEAVQFRDRAPLLEGAGRLHVLVLHAHHGAGELGKPWGRNERRAQHMALDRARGAFNIGEADGVIRHVSSPRPETIRGVYLSWRKIRRAGSPEIAGAAFALRLVAALGPGSRGIRLDDRSGRRRARRRERCPALRWAGRRTRGSRTARSRTRPVARLEPSRSRR